MTTRTDRTELPWWSKNRVLRPRTLSGERIVEVGLELIDRDGLEGLSMRRLGAALDAGATSIYWHVPNKDALLDLIVDQLLREAVDSMHHEPGATWRSDLAAHAVALRLTLARHRAAAALLASRVPVGPHGLRFMEGVLGVLAGAGFGARQRALAYAALTGYTIGQAVLQARLAPTTTPRGDIHGDQTKVLGSLLKGAPRGRFPNVFESAADIAALTDEEAFDYGLQRMLDGLEAELRPVNPRRRLF